MITLICGPMFSGKSSMLISHERKLHFANKNYVTINHSFDNRYSDDCKITTHDKIHSQCKKHITASSIEELEKYSELFESIDAIIIDEVQFFNDISIFVGKWASKGKTVVCAGLNGDYKMNPFPSMVNLFSIADKITHSCAICVKCGADAPFTARIIKNDSVNLVGGSETYEPRCRKCFSL